MVRDVCEVHVRKVSAQDYVWTMDSFLDKIYSYLYQTFNILCNMIIV